jgi:hypothetical protein
MVSTANKQLFSTERLIPVPKSAGIGNDADDNHL